MEYIEKMRSDILLLLDQGFDFHTAFTQIAHENGIFWGKDKVSYNFHFRKLKASLANFSRRKKKQTKTTSDFPKTFSSHRPYFDRKMAASGEKEDDDG